LHEITAAPGFPSRARVVPAALPRGIRVRRHFRLLRPAQATARSESHRSFQNPEKRAMRRSRDRMPHIFDPADGDGPLRHAYATRAPVAATALRRACGGPIVLALPLSCAGSDRQRRGESHKRLHTPGKRAMRRLRDNTDTHRPGGRCCTALARDARCVCRGDGAPAPRDVTYAGQRDGVRPPPTSKHMKQKQQNQHRDRNVESPQKYDPHDVPPWCVHYDVDTSFEAWRNRGRQHHVLVLVAGRIGPHPKMGSTPPGVADQPDGITGPEPAALRMSRHRPPTHALARNPHIQAGLDSNPEPQFTPSR
jgi:hypothetical protein